MNNYEKHINLLWTGGLDSTFRLLQLISCDVDIQPYYVINPGRNSTLYEIKAMGNIREKILKYYPHTKYRLKRTIYLSVNDISADQEITNKYNNLIQQGHLGTQYEWLARFAKEQDNKIFELGIVKGGGFGYKNLKNYVIKCEDNVIGYYYKLDPATSDDNDMQLLRYFTFPILDWTKADIIQYAKMNGCLDIINSTWFCFNPFKGKACGLCTSCNIYMRNGLTDKFTNYARKRHKYVKPVIHIKRRVKAYLKRR